MATDKLDIRHMEWLVTRRSRNQSSTLDLFRLFERYSKKRKTSDLSAKASRLVAVCFSHWRAVFLADKTGTREAVFSDASAFLAKLISDNAIGYVQDRNTREWTFNYYMNAAVSSLNVLSRSWPTVDKVLNRTRNQKGKGLSVSQRRWDRQHEAFEEALKCFAEELDKAKSIKATKN